MALTHGEVATLYRAACGHTPSSGGFASVSDPTVESIGYSQSYPRSGPTVATIAAALATIGAIAGYYCYVRTGALSGGGAIGTVVYAKAPTVAIRDALVANGFTKIHDP